MKTIQWFLLHTRCHFQPLVTFGQWWLEMATHERQKPFHFLHTRDGKQILIFLFKFVFKSRVQDRKKCSLDIKHPSILMWFFFSSLFWKKEKYHSRTICVICVGLSINDVTFCGDSRMVAQGARAPPHTLVKCSCNNDCGDPPGLPPLRPDLGRRDLLDPDRDVPDPDGKGVKSPDKQRVDLFLLYFREDCFGVDFDNISAWFWKDTHKSWHQNKICTE